MGCNEGEARQGRAERRWRSRACSCWRSCSRSCCCRGGRAQDLARASGATGTVLSAHVHARARRQLLWGHARVGDACSTGALSLSPAQARGAAAGSATAWAPAGELRQRAGGALAAGRSAVCASTGAKLQRQASVDRGRPARGAARECAGAGGEHRGRKAQSEVTVAGGAVRRERLGGGRRGARQGELVAEPRGLLSLGGLARVTLFSDPHLHVQAFDARAVAGRRRLAAAYERHA